MHTQHPQLPLTTDYRPKQTIAYRLKRPPTTYYRLKKLATNFLLPATLCLAQLPAIAQTRRWTKNKLEQRNAANLDSAKWNLDLLRRDIEHRNDFADLPLNKGAFPVADYDYFVSANPFTEPAGEYTVHGVAVGDNNEGKKSWHFAVFIRCAKDADVQSSDLAFSRNYPYFTAQGYFQVNGDRFDWLTATAPDGFGLAFVNMKLFDLRFGKTIFIFPLADHSFRYLQLDVNPDRFGDFEGYKRVILQHPEVVKGMGW